MNIIKFRLQIKCIFLSLLFVSYVLSLQAASTITVLCYHQIKPGAKGQFELTPEAFREQLGIIKAQGYRSINSGDLLHLLRKDVQPTGRPIAITFDDGYASVYHYAFPIMKEFGFVGIACIYPKFIGAGNALTWDQLREMASAGWSIESHSMTHSDLSKGYGNEAYKKMLEYEILDSRRIIEKQIGNKVLFMVWPYGIYTDIAEEFARQCGYAGAMTVDAGGNYPGLDPFWVKRQVIYRSDSREKFLIRLEMAALEVTDQKPRPGAVVKSVASVSCKLYALNDYSPENYVLNVKITGGALNFKFDNESKELSAYLKSPLPVGHRFIDVYVRDRRTGITAQHGWLFNIVR